MKPIYRSETTKNVLAGATVGAGGSMLIVNLIRQFAPDLLPWPADYDTEVLAGFTIFVVPFLSRAIAFLRDKSKKLRNAAKAIMMLAIVVGFTACVTTTHPDGRIEQRPDLEALILANQIAVQNAEVALDLWLIYNESKGITDQARFERQREEREARIEQMREILEALVALQQQNQ